MNVLFFNESVPSVAQQCHFEAQRPPLGAFKSVSVSQSLRSLVILVHCFTGTVNLSPLGLSLLSMHTAPSLSLSLSVHSHSHTSVMSLFDIYFFSLLVTLRISLFTGKNVFCFLLKFILQRVFFLIHDTKLEITQLLFSLRKEMILIQSIICI